MYFTLYFYTWIFVVFSRPVILPVCTTRLHHPPPLLTVFAEPRYSLIPIKAPHSPCSLCMRPCVSAAFLRDPVSPEHFILEVCHELLCFAGRGGSGPSSEDIWGAERGVARRAAGTVGQVRNGQIQLYTGRSVSLRRFMRVFVCARRRVGVYVNTFQSLAGHQEKFHKEMSKVSQTDHLGSIKQRFMDQSVTSASRLRSSAKTWTTSWPSWRSSGSSSKFSQTL